MSERKNGSNVSQHEEPAMRIINEIWKLVDNVSDEAQKKGIIIHDITRIKELIGLLRNYIQM